MTASDGRPYHNVMGEVVPEGVKVKASMINKRQFLRIEGDIEKVAAFIAQLMHSLDWHIGNRTPAERLEIQRRIDELTFDQFRAEE